MLDNSEVVSVYCAELFSRLACDIYHVLHSVRVCILSRRFGVCAVEGAEDPERILDQAVTDMNNDLIKLRQATAKVRAYIAGRSLCVFRLPMR